MTVLSLGPHQRLLADCVARAFESEGIDVVRTNPSMTGELLGLVPAFGPAVYLVDGAVFESGGGQDLADRVHERGGKILIVAADSTRENSPTLAARGADGIVFVTDELCSLVSAVRRAMAVDEAERCRSCEPTADRGSASPLDRQRLASLSPREQVVLDCMIEGMSAPEIAEAEFVAVPTVRSQIRSILGKLQVNSQLAAVALAHRAGWNAAIRHNHQF